MKTINKKAILAMLVAMIMSLGVMGSISSNKQNEDSNLQQVGAVCAGIGASTEGFWSGFSYSIGVSASTIGVGGAIALLSNQWHPGGWVAAGVIGGGIL
jgi:hypothetical protein